MKMTMLAPWCGRCMLGMHQPTSALAGEALCRALPNLPFSKSPLELPFPFIPVLIAVQMLYAHHACLFPAQPAQIMPDTTSLLQSLRQNLDCTC